METSAQHHYEYEFTTTRIVLLIVSIVLWLLISLARTARAAEAWTSKTASTRDAVTLAC